MTPTTSDPKYDSIRPYLDEEAYDATRRLLTDPELRLLLPSLFPGLSYEELEQLAEGIHSIADFKLKVAMGMVDRVAARSTFSLTSSGKSGLDKGYKHTFISNHRDIILDSAFLNVISYEGFGSLPRIAIGDNLLIRPWIRDLVRLCDAFIVKRAPSIREMLAESMLLSQYIRTTITAGEQSVWIAQREGRAKDSDDRTQPAMLKMLAMSGDAPEAEALEALHIVPLTISYEYDPCDYLKARETYLKQVNPEYKKTPEDDMLNMQTGLLGRKGRVHFAFSPELKGLSELVAPCKTKQDRLNVIAAKIDEQIFLHYRFYPNNYAAYDLLHGGDLFGHMYSSRERLRFELHVQDQIEKIQIPGSGRNREVLSEILMRQYANPLINHLKAKGHRR